MTNPLLGTQLIAVPVTALYAAFNVFLTVGLSLNVSRVRARHNLWRGDGGHADLIAAIRAHGNNVENVPVALLLLLVAELCGGNSMVLHAFGGALLVARGAHASGMILASRTQALGAMLTLGVQLGLAGYMLWLRPWG